MRPEIERAIAERAFQQLGRITTTQARSLGMSYDVIAARERTGYFTREGRRTLVLAGAPRTLDARILTACLDVGGTASHRTGAWLHALDPFGTPDPIEISVRKNRRSAVSELALVHTSTNLTPADIVVVRGVPTTSVARTLLDVSALVPHLLSRDMVLGAVESAIRDRKASMRWLWWLLEERRCRGRNGVLTLEGVLSELDELGPTESWLERATLELIESAGLPKPTLQTVFRRRGAFVSRVDFVYEDAKVAIEVTGKKDPARRETEARQSNELQLMGYLVLTFTYHEVVNEPARVVRMIKTALRRAA
jgi:hypothetical protein